MMQPPKQTLISCVLLSCRINLQRNSPKHCRTLRCKRVHDAYVVKDLFIEGLSGLTRHIMRSYMGPKKSNTVHDLARHAISLTKARPMQLVTKTRQTTCVELLDAEEAMLTKFIWIHSRWFARLLCTRSPLDVDPFRRQSRYSPNSQRGPHNRVPLHRQQHQSAMRHSAVFVLRTTIQGPNALPFRLYSSQYISPCAIPTPYYWKKPPMVPNAFVMWTGTDQILVKTDDATVSKLYKHAAP